MENSTLARLVNELQKKLHHSTLERVQQLNEVQLLLRFRHGRLLVSADHQHPTLYLKQSSAMTGTRAASPFALLAQKYLARGRLDSIEQVNGDRIVRLRVTTWGESRQPSQASLVAELISRRANLYLLDGEDRVIAQLKRRRHTVQPWSARYAPPEQTDRIGIPAVTPRHLEQLKEHEGPLERMLVQTVKGISPLIAKEVAWEAQRMDTYAAFHRVIEAIRAEESNPCIYSPVPLDQLHPGQTDWIRDLILSPIHLNWPTKVAGFVCTEFATMCDALETYEQLVEQIRAFQVKKQGMVGTLHRQRKRLQRRRERLAEAMDQLGDYNRFRRFGELLLSQTRQAVRGAEGFIVTDYYDPGQESIVIPAEAKLTPEQAANVYFERYQKSKRKLAAIREQCGIVEQQMTRLNELTQQLEAAATANDLEAIHESPTGKAMMGSGLLGAKEKRLQKIPGINRFHSSDHHEILVGRSAEANQRLTFKIARPHDLWFHAADYPGSHVVLRKAKREAVPFPALVEAAQLAAFYSQARREGKVAVSYTERKYVLKIRGAPPGMVRLADRKTITVEPRVNAVRADIER